MEQYSQLIRDLLIDYREMRPLPALLPKYKSYKNVNTDPIDWTDVDVQERVYNEVISHPLCKDFPPSRSYTAKFIKMYLDQVDAQRKELYEDLFSLYMELTKEPEAPNQACHRAYYVNNTWDPNKDPKIGVTIRLTQNWNSVGMTTWPAGFYLAEVIAANKNLFDGKVVLELGAGVGITGILLKWMTQTRSTILTDYTREILNNMYYNMQINEIEATELSQAKPEDFNNGKLFVDEFDWSTFEMTKLPVSVDVIIAADVVYDEDLTVSLVATLNKLLRSKDNNGKTPFALIAQTPRRPQSKEHFIKSLEELQLDWEDVTKSTEKRNLFDFDYSNNSEVTLFKIKAK
jgi:predicted nicotinamide N-methyase